MNLVQRRPAETGSVVALAIAYLLIRVLGLENDETLTWSIATVVAFVPAAITWLVNIIRKG